ncbi:MAG: hypothetical protein KGI50_06480 [Patescibacteria group bacterium]|nr:hypothetical protein [Patescibacteria group bacterium]MDE2439179.1 hypothetical protein [Patescibacteria group bacterium]
MRLEVIAQMPSFNAKGYVEQYFKDLKHQYFLAASDFLNIAAPSVPIDTGMARGSFLNLLNLLEANNIPINTDIPRLPQHVNKNGTPLTYVHWDGTRLDKTPVNGAALSTRTNRIIAKQGNKLIFTYETEVWHYNIHDPNSWHSYARGQAAFALRMQNFVPPKPGTFVRILNFFRGQSASPRITYNT